MKKLLTVRATRKFYLANAIGMVIVIAAAIFSLTKSIDATGVRISSTFFWVFVILMLMIPIAVIHFLSSMKTIVLTEKGLVITYIFRNQSKEILMSEIAEMKDLPSRSAIKSAGFTIRLHDNRIFEFQRSSLDKYDTLQSLLAKRLR